MTDPLDANDSDLTASVAPDGAADTAVPSGGTGLVGSMARRLGAAAPAGLVPRQARDGLPGLPALGSAPASPSGGEGESGAQEGGFDTRGALVSEAHLGDPDLHAEYAFAQIGLAALTRGDPAPARDLVGLVSDPSSQAEEAGNSAEMPAVREGMGSSDLAEFAARQDFNGAGPARRGTWPGDPGMSLDNAMVRDPVSNTAAGSDPGLLVDSSDVARGLGYDAVDPEIFARGAAPGSERSAPPQIAATGQAAVPARQTGEAFNYFVDPQGRPSRFNEWKVETYEHQFKVGGSPAWINNSPGNLFYSKSSSAVIDNGGEPSQSVPGKAKFETMEKGRQALKDLLLKGKGYRGQTVRQGMASFADAKHHPIEYAGYLAYLKQRGIDLDAPIDSQIDALTAGIEAYEVTQPGRVISRVPGSAPEP